MHSSRPYPAFYVISWNRKVLPVETRRGSDMVELTAAYIDAIAAVAEEHLGQDHECIKTIKEARKSRDADPGGRVLAAVRRLPTAHRDHILLHAKVRMKEEADIVNWLSRRSGLPSDVPPDATRH